MAQISIFRTGSREEAEAFKDKMQGKTYLDFNVLICPDHGEVEVWIQSIYADGVEELREMVMMVMAESVIGEAA